LLLAAPALAQSHGEDELTRWVPGISFSFDMLQHKARGQITTSNVLGPPLGQGGCAITRTFQGVPITTFNGTLCPNSEFPLTIFTSGGDTDVAPLVNASLELATPRLVAAFFSPRLFAHADAAIAFGFERTLAGERKPAPFFVDPIEPPRTEYSEGEVGGQGSRALVQLEQFVAGGGAGVAFTTALFGRTLRLKPSLEYLYEKVDLIASVHRAVKLRDPARAITDFRLIELTANDKQALHGLGAGLELEVDAARMGPVGVSVFILARAYKFTGNLHHSFNDTNEFGESANWHFDLDPWAYRGAVGARFRWIPAE
jgi:hypothetical protein